MRESRIMRIFIAGATGAVGRRLTPLLTAKGHPVFGLTRTPDKVQLLQSWGAEPIVADARDADAIERAMARARPEIVVHQLTALAGASDMRNFDSAFAGSNRLRTAGLEILIAAARKSGARRFVAQSYCGWPFARVGGEIKTEDDALDSTPPRRQAETLAAIRHLETTVAGLEDLEGVVLRYGGFYGPGTGWFEPEVVRQVRKRQIPVIGGGGGWWSFLHIDDAASATVAAIESRVCGLFNVVDDDPAPAREWLPALANALSARPPRKLPAWIARLVAGDALVTMMTESRAGSNAKAKRELAWTPAFGSWREGFAQVARSIRTDET
jgi:nucleoside-diphosphate-sugar epimerase